MKTRCLWHRELAAAMLHCVNVFPTAAKSWRQALILMSLSWEFDEFALSWVRHISFNQTHASLEIESEIFPFPLTSFNSIVSNRPISSGRSLKDLVNRMMAPLTLSIVWFSCFELKNKFKLTLFTYSTPAKRNIVDSATPIIHVCLNQRINLPEMYICRCDIQFSSADQLVCVFYGYRCSVDTHTLVATELNERVYKDCNYGTAARTLTSR